MAQPPPATVGILRTDLEVMVLVETERSLELDVTSLVIAFLSGDDLLGVETHVADCQNCWNGRHIHLELTIEIGDGTGGRTFDQHIDTDERFAVRIRDNAYNRCGCKAYRPQPCSAVRAAYRKGCASLRQFGSSAEYKRVESRY